MPKNNLETRLESLEKVINTLQIDLKNSETRLDNKIEAKITSEMENLLKGWKMQRDMMFDTIETIKTTQNLFVKETNMKIGALKGLETKRTKPEIIAETDSLEEAIALANIERKKNGLPPLNIPHIDQKSMILDKEEETKLPD